MPIRRSFQCPFLSATDVGTALFTDDEAETLRAYLEKGGFLWVDDFWGPYAWDNWVSNISKVLPPGEYPIRDIPLDHPIRRTLFEFKELPQIPSINFWSQSGGETSERYELSAEPHFRGIADQQGRLMVVMTHNTDISDAWEREAEDPQFFFSFSPQGYAVGLDVFLYGHDALIGQGSGSVDQCRSSSGPDRVRPSPSSPATRPSTGSAPAGRRARAAPAFRSARTPRYCASALIEVLVRHRLRQAALDSAPPKSGASSASSRLRSGLQRRRDRRRRIGSSIGVITRAAIERGRAPALPRRGS